MAPPSCRIQAEWGCQWLEVVGEGREELSGFSTIFRLIGEICFVCSAELLPSSPKAVKSITTLLTYYDNIPHIDLQSTSISSCASCLYHTKTTLIHSYTDKGTFIHSSSAISLSTIHRHSKQGPKPRVPQSVMKRWKKKTQHYKPISRTKRERQGVRDEPGSLVAPKADSLRVAKR